MADERTATRLRSLIPGEVIDPAPPRLRVPPRPLPRSAPRRPPHWHRDLGYVLLWVAVGTVVLTLAVLAGQRAASRLDVPPAPTAPALDVEQGDPLDGFGSD